MRGGRRPVLLFPAFFAALLFASLGSRAIVTAPRVRPAPVAQTDSGDKGKQNADELNRLKKAAEEKRRLAKELQGKEKSVLGRLRKADEALNATRSYINQLEASEIRIQNEIGSREVALGAASEELEQRRTRLVAWMREAYKKGRARGLEVMFSAASFSDLLKRSYFLSAVMQQERRFLDSVKEQKRLVENEKSELEKRRGEIVSVRGEKENESKR